MNVVCLVAKFQVYLKEIHVTNVKRIFRYLKGTIDYGFWYLNDDDFTSCAYIDTDWAGYVDD